MKTLKQFSHVFGPYPGMNTKATMKILRRLFLFSNCQQKKRSNARPKGSAFTANATIERAPIESRVTPSGKEALKANVRPCFYYQMGQCLGVCTGEITPAEYKKRVINPLVMFLRGKKKPLIKNLESRMKNLARAHEFEEAARVRDQVRRLQHIHDIAMLNKSYFADDLEMGKEKREMGRIEGYDISNLGATGVVGSMVVFVDGEPDKSQYRKFKIRTFAGQSDVDALAEVLERRFKHGKVISRDYWPLPDLILVDGGKPQVNRAQKILQEHKLKIPLVGIAKGPERKRNDIVIGDWEKKKEKGKRGIENLKISQWVYAHTRLLITIRDEAHRFAIAYQRKLRNIK